MFPLPTSPRQLQEQLEDVDRALATSCAALSPDRLGATEAAGLIAAAALLERRAAGLRLRLARRIDDSVAGAEGENGPARWLARQTGQSVRSAAEDLAASEALIGLGATDTAVRDGQLTPLQAHEVTSAALLDPTAEQALLGTAREGSVAELRRHGKRVRAAATDDEQKHEDAHTNRDVSSSTDEETAEGRIGVRGPASAVAVMLALLEPWVQAEFRRARTDGRRERRGAYVFDALLAALGFADRVRRGRGADPATADLAAPSGPPVSILARVDLPALLRGHTRAGELCEIDGFGPVPIAALRELLPQAAVDVIVTNGVDVYNVTHFGRRANARQQVVLDLIGAECSRLGCTATRSLQVDHRIDWAATHVTELHTLDKLCPADHRRKTHEGWALVAGRGKRRMVPPEHPDHPANAPPVPSAMDPPDAVDGQRSAA